MACLHGNARLGLLGVSVERLRLANTAHEVSASCLPRGNLARLSMCPKPFTVHRGPWVKHRLCNRRGSINGGFASDA